MTALLLILGFLAQDKSSGKTPDPLPEGPGKKEVVAICTECHGPETIVNKKRSKDQWEDVINDMISKGATAKDEEFDTIVAYLAKNFGK